MENWVLQFWQIFDSMISSLACQQILTIVRICWHVSFTSNSSYNFRLITLFAVYDFWAIGRIRSLKFIRACTSAVKVNCLIRIYFVLRFFSAAGTFLLPKRERISKCNARRIAAIKTFPRNRNLHCAIERQLLRNDAVVSWTFLARQNLIYFELRNAISVPPLSHNQISRVVPPLWYWRTKCAFLSLIESITQFDRRAVSRCSWQDTHPLNEACW